MDSDIPKIYETLQKTEELDKYKQELSINLIDNEENINAYDNRIKIGRNYDNYLSFEYSNYLNQDVIENYYINLQDTSLYNYFTTYDSVNYGKKILDIIFKLTIIIIIILIIYYGLQLLDGKLISSNGIFSNNIEDIKNTLSGMYGQNQLFNLENKYILENIYGDYNKKMIDVIKNTINNYGVFIYKFELPLLKKLSTIIFITISFVILLLISYTKA